MDISNYSHIIKNIKEAILSSRFHVVKHANKERFLENEIVLNIKKFIMLLGSDFSFIGNQHRLMVDDDEYFIDLLFYNRILHSFDEYVKKEHEKPSIGIILCKEKKNKTVEFAIRDFNKAVGVATYNTSKNLPKEFQNILPDAETLMMLVK